ncbi:hypothetical protein Q7P36_009457 [Cladosporium allicinum]
MSSTQGPQDSANTGRRGGGRGRGRGSGGAPGGARGGVHKEAGDNAANARDGADGGGRGGRGRGRGRGGRGRGNRDRAQSQGQGSAQSQPTQQPAATGVLGGRLVKDAQSAEGQEDDDSDMCFICASNIDHYSVAPCNHRTCHVCALRMRALYKTKACAHCRSEAPTVIFTDDAEKRFEDYKTGEFFRNDGNMGICYEKQEIFEDTVVLLRYNCPDADCDEACLGWPDLHRHVRTKHQKVMCDMCTRNKKVFTHEHQLFTPQELRKHERTGDDAPGSEEQTGFKGHPECHFCRQRFYGNDELYLHCRDRHERCHLCDRAGDPNNPRYFLDYNDLESHFNNDHYPCMDAECLEKKFVVFDSAMDLKAHQVSEHPNGLTKDARKVDLSGFNYRSEYQQDRPQRGGRREARGGRGGRGRDPNAEGPPPTTSAHMTRAEIAHQRNREIQSAQSVTSRSFGGSLSQPAPPSQVVPRPSHEARSAPTQQPQQPDTGASNLASMASEQLTPQEQARRLRHAAVTERAANLLQNDQTKLTEFRQRISAFRNGTLSAPNLIETFFALFDTTSNELGKLIKEIAEIFEIPGKRDALLKAWSDWKAINEDYPSLPAPAGESSSSAVGLLGGRVGTSRVLKLKSSTAQSSRGSVGHQANWAANKRPPVPGNTPLFPALPSRGKGSAAPAPTPSWLAPPKSQPSSSVGSSARVSPAPSRSQSSVNLARGADAFPSLPAARKPTSTVFSPGYSGAGVIRQSNSSTPVNAWGGSGDSGPSTPSGEASNQRQAKGRKGKQVMYQWG